MRPAKRRRYATTISASSCRSELTEALRQEFAPKVNIIRHRSLWGSAVANFNRFAESLAAEFTSMRVEGDEAAFWKITWCANAASLMMGASLPAVGGDDTHLRVLRTADRLAAAADRLALVRWSSTDLDRAIALYGVIIPALELYETCCFLRSTVAQQMLLHSALVQLTQGGSADCLLMVVPILLPNLCGALRYLAEALPKRIDLLTPARRPYPHS